MRKRHLWILAAVVLLSACNGDDTPQPPAPGADITVTDSAGLADDHQVPFGTVTKDTVVDQTVTVTNSGTDDLVVGTVTALDVPFSIDSSGCSGAILAPAGSCTMTVSFISPGGILVYFEDSFDIPSNDPDSPMVTVFVNGTGEGGPTVPPPSSIGVHLPATGQITPYVAGDDGSLQVGAIWPIPRFSVTYCDTTGPCADQGSDCDSDHLNDVVTDSLTGLVWARNGNLPAATKTWQEALTYSNDSTLCGSADWRIPNRRELRSLINFGLTNIHTWLNGQGFSGVLCGKYWTSTTYAWGANKDNAWVASLCDGTTAMNPKTGTQWYALPVRGGEAFPAAVPETGQRKCFDEAGSEIACSNTGQDGDLLQGMAWPAPRFNDNEDGTVTDRLTGLTWTTDANAPGPAGCTPGTAKTWQGALDYVACLNSNSYLGGGWRLPNVNELESLFHAGFNEETCNASACATNADWLMTQGPTNVQIYYWSSTTYEGDPTFAWVLFMHEGFVQPDVKTADYYVWPVKGGQ